MNMNSIEISDIITLDNDKEYMVSGKTLYGNVNYLYLINTNDYSMDFAAVSGNNVILLDNKNDKTIIDELIPLFLQSITKMYMESNK